MFRITVKPTYNQLQEQLKKSEETADFLSEKNYELEEEIEVQRGLKRKYRQKFQQLHEENRQLKQSTVSYTINLSTKDIDVKELSKAVMENINKGRY